MYEFIQPKTQLARVVRLVAFSICNLLFSDHTNPMYNKIILGPSKTVVPLLISTIVFLARNMYTGNVSRSLQGMFPDSTTPLSFKHLSALLSPHIMVPFIVLLDLNS